MFKAFRTKLIQLGVAITMIGLLFAGLTGIAHAAQPNYVTCSRTTVRYINSTTWNQGYTMTITLNGYFDASQTSTFCGSFQAVSRVTQEPYQLGGKLIAELGGVAGYDYQNSISFGSAGSSSVTRTVSVSGSFGGNNCVTANMEFYVSGQSTPLGPAINGCG